MPPPKKLDLIPTEIRQWLAELLMSHGFGNIVEVTEELNTKLETEGVEIRLGKSSVGDFSKLLKDQRDAFAMAETLLNDMDVEAESNMHKVLMQMIATAAFQMMQNMSQQDGHFDPKGLANLSRMLKDLMHSAGIREKLLDDERTRIAEEARKSAEAAASERFEDVIGEAGLSEDRISAMRTKFLGLKS